MSGGSSPDDDGAGWHRQTARVGKRDGEVHDVGTSGNPLKWTAGSNLVDVGRSAVRAVAEVGGGNSGQV